MNADTVSACLLCIVIKVPLILRYHRLQIFLFTTCDRDIIFPFLMLLKSKSKTHRQKLLITTTSPPLEFQTGRELRL